MFIAFFTFYYYLLLCNMAKKEVVQDIFNDIAPKYDLLNHLLSMNIDKGWRRKAMSCIGEQSCGKKNCFRNGTLSLVR